MSHIEARNNLDSYVDSFFDDEEPRQPAYCDSCANLFSIGCPSNRQLAGVELCPYYVPRIGQGTHDAAR